MPQTPKSKPSIAALGRALRALSAEEMGELVYDLWGDDAGCLVLDKLYEAATERGTSVDRDDVPPGGHLQ